MGACGCGDFQPDYWIPGPDGKVYAVTIYPGCRYCNNPAGIGLDLMTRQQFIEQWDCGHVPELKLTDGMGGIPVIGADHLLKSLDSLLTTEEIEVLESGELYGPMARAVTETAKEYAKNVQL